MELVQHGNLSDLIDEKVSRGEIFSDEEASKIVKSILEAVEYMHSKNILHRDLKPENILMAHPTDFSQIKVADFGLSAKYESSQIETRDERWGTLIFMGPELLLGSVYSKSVEVFATGIIMYMLLTGGKHPIYDAKTF